MRNEREETEACAQLSTFRLDRVAVDQRVAAVAAEGWGVVSTAELLGCGLSHQAIATRRRGGRLHRLHRGAYAVGHPNPPWQGRLLAAAKACGPAAVLSHSSAATLWGLLDFDEHRYPEVTVLNGGGGHHPGIRVHRTSTLISRDRSRAQLVPVTAPARTLLDLAAIVDGAALRSLVRRAQGLSRVNLRQLHEVLIRLRPRRGSRRLASVIATGPAPTRTVLEDVVLDLLLSGGFEHPDVNQPLRIGDRRLIPDFRWPCERLIVEADGGAWHDEKVAREDDAERQGLLEAHGERVLRVSWNQAVSQPSETLTRIRAAGAPLARSSRATRPEPRRVRGGATGRR